ncbi:glycosyl hydrolase [Elizabethkingia meningoseptica]|uniref:glycosyl hydrolase n=1 Tax=Elizabethkingia meningoseptica TaxID=238 RepID=UPI0022F1A4F1|nr:glycosyl hydrolase [Elizabethkingia meningoseptica]EJK5328766.1 glycosyl hydrolase [Elizabethkingia meningoseptica]MDE5467720.1 glycosyl hydrolase [Elizabethkingia meningoseptica]MDE5474639.1 glycosyl hydrolase [Elizabethkingia meningoseptica]MDE5478072.1 glycosyl hydrolase [Elizabethkingia meningoseptica]MDE5485979.1 glycosyl hydrolase [Elizabethkingia meningoseptica]
MKNILTLGMLSVSIAGFAQKVEFKTLLKDKISIRALQVSDGKVWYSGTDSKFGFVSIKDTLNKKQIRLSDQNLQFRTLEQDKKYFYAINIESPANFYKIDKKKLGTEISFRDDAKTAFYDALHFTKEGTAYAFSDSDENLNLKLAELNKNGKWSVPDQKLKLNKGEAAFAASNTNIASSKNYLWIATGGVSSRMLRKDFKAGKWEVFNTPFVQGKSSQGMYSVDFCNDKFGIAVGGDYTSQKENRNNIATTYDGGKTWQIQASGQNGGYMTCVKIKPGSKGKEIIAVGDQHISYSSDYGITWNILSEEKNLYVCEWLDKHTVVFAGKDKIMKMTFQRS